MERMTKEPGLIAPQPLVWSSIGYGRAVALTKLVLHECKGGFCRRRDGDNFQITTLFVLWFSQGWLSAVVQRFEPASLLNPNNLSQKEPSMMRLMCSIPGHNTFSVYISMGMIVARLKDKIKQKTACLLIGGTERPRQPLRSKSLALAENGYELIQPITG